MPERRQPGAFAKILGRFVLLDVLVDRRARPVLVYVAATMMVSAVLYHYIEGWGWLDCLYFVVITSTTIGYGDLVPTTQLGRLVTIFVALNGVAILFMLFDQIRRIRAPLIERKD